MLPQWDDETLEPTRLAGFDMSEPTARNQVSPVIPDTTTPSPCLVDGDMSKKLARHNHVV